MECLLLTVFLLALTAVLAQFFSAARTQALEARRLTDAQRLAQDISEEWYAASDETDFCQMAGVDGDGGEVTRTGPSGEDYLLRLYTIQEPETCGRTVTLYLEVLTEGRESVCSLEFVRYWPD